MKYGSVCSGIEAASLAWHGLGWKPLFFGEVEPFPSAVLMRRWDATKPLRPLDPDEASSPKDRKTRESWERSIDALPEGGSVPNLGDFTKIRETDYDGAIDLLVGGTPCQAFSIAGLRKGLADPRGNLCLEFAKLAFRSRARLVVWENVPGVLTSGKGGDFAGFLSLLAGWEVPIPNGGWQRAGIVTPAPGCYGVAWRVLDAQYTRVPEFPGAVPQRRRRVILVGHLGSWEYPAKVLFDGEMCGGTDAPRREAGQGSAEDSQGRAPRAHTVRMRAGKPGGGKGALVSEELSLTLQTGNDQTLFQFPCWWDGSQQSATITASSDHQFMPDKQQLQCVIDMRQIDAGEGVSPTLLSTDYKGGKAICDEVCPTLDANYPAKMNRQDVGKLVQEVYAFDSMASHAMNSPNPKSGIHRIDVSRTLDTLDPSPSKNQGGMAIVEEKTLGFIKNDAGGTDTKGEDVFPTIRADVMPAVATSGAVSVVRKLMPVECERLMGMPDGYTRIPWKGKPESECPDGPRYKALGNSMCVNVMMWVGQRIDALEKAIADGREAVKC